MARSWQYPRWRRYVMQAVMWLLLGATLALARLDREATASLLQHRIGAEVQARLREVEPAGSDLVRLTLTGAQDTSQ